MPGYPSDQPWLTMKKNFVYIASLILVLVSGCSPMAYDDISSSAGLEFKRDEYEITAQDNGTGIEIRFAVIPDAKSYGYGTNSKNVIQFSASDLKFDSGYYVATIDKSSEVFSGTDSSTAKRSGGSLSVILFASRETAPKDNWVIVKTVDVELSLTTAPDFSATNRMKDSVTLKANSESVAGGMEYKVEYGEGKSVTFTSSEYELTGIGTDAFTLTIAHRYAGTSEYSSATQTLTISAYDERQGAIGVEINEENGSIKASNLTPGYNYVGIFEVGADGELSGEPLYSQPYTGDTVTFDKNAVFGEGFYAGRIRVVLFNNSINDANAILSIDRNYSSPITKLNEKVGKQSYSVTIPVSDKVTITKIDVSDKTNFKYETTEDGSIRVWADAGTLISRTPYSVKLTITTSSGSSSFDFDFTTESFLGDYYWAAGDLSFAVVVENAPVESDANYYIFVSPNDVNNLNGPTDLRLAPFYDISAGIGESFPGEMSYDSAPEAYKWNNKKWNNSPFNPEKLTNVEVFEFKDDYIKTKVYSYAFFMTIETTTSFEFKEKSDGSCWLVFYNEITDGMGSKYLRTNPYPKAENFEKNNYYYALELQK